MERLYLDTSVFGGFFEEEFEEWTQILFERILLGKYQLIYSELTDSELLKAPQEVRELVGQIPESSLNFVEITPPAMELADQYISEGVVGKSSRSDCLHIALATLHHADVLISWNFKHIVNLKRIRGYNSINYRMGHQVLEIRTPREVIEYED